jgi:hypothetical protein
VATPESVEIIEVYGSGETLESSAMIMGFDSDRNAFRKMRHSFETGFGTWEPHGNALDYRNNREFAAGSGCSHELDIDVSALPSRSQEELDMVDAELKARQVEKHDNSGIGG